MLEGGEVRDGGWWEAGEADRALGRPQPRRAGPTASLAPVVTGRAGEALQSRSGAAVGVVVSVGCKNAATVQQSLENESRYSVQRGLKGGFDRYREL